MGCFKLIFSHIGCERSNSTGRKAMVWGGVREPGSLCRGAEEQGCAELERVCRGESVYCPCHASGFPRGVMHTHQSPAPGGEFDFLVADHILGD